MLKCDDAWPDGGVGAWSHEKTRVGSAACSSSKSNIHAITCPPHLTTGRESRWGHRSQGMECQGVLAGGPTAQVGTLDRSSWRVEEGQPASMAHYSMARCSMTRGGTSRQGRARGERTSLTSSAL